MDMSDLNEWMIEMAAQEPMPPSRKRGVRNESR